MADAEAPNEAFKRNTGAALRALSAVRELEVTFGPENATTDGRSARLPTPSRDLPPGEVAILRGEADALAMKLRHHDENAHVCLDLVNHRIFAACHYACTGRLCDDAIDGSSFWHQFF